MLGSNGYRRILHLVLRENLLHVLSLAHLGSLVSSGVVVWHRRDGLQNGVGDLVEVGLIYLAEVDVDRFDVVLQVEPVPFKVIAAGYHFVSDALFDDLFVQEVGVGVFLHLGVEYAILLDNELKIVHEAFLLSDISTYGVLSC